MCSNEAYILKIDIDLLDLNISGGCSIYIACGSECHVIPWKHDPINFVHIYRKLSVYKE